MVLLPLWQPKEVPTLHALLAQRRVVLADESGRRTIEQALAAYDEVLEEWTPRVPKDGPLVENSSWSPIQPPPSGSGPSGWGDWESKRARKKKGIFQSFVHHTAARAPPGRNYHPKAFNAQRD